MRFWTREIAGWLLLVVGLFVFYICFMLLLNRQILEAGPLTLIGIVIFRGGIHLLKVAVAARVCLTVQERAAASPPVTAPPAPPNWRPERSVVGDRLS